MSKINEALKEACSEAIAAIDKAKATEFLDIRSKLVYVIGSYEFDQNPIGLHEIGKLALQNLETLKEANPKKVTKKTVDTIQKALAAYESNN